MRGAAADIGPQIEFLLAQGQQVTLQVSGDSMRPTLKPRRDAVVLSALQSWPPRRGDILFFRSARSAAGYSLHRVVRVRPEGVFMNGDAQGWVEGPVPRDAVLARAVALVRKGKPMNVQAPAYRVYVALWRFTRPVRWPMFALWRALKGALKR
jgi:signal peptidase I